jgi:ADP-ribose pyrophosphatase
MKIIGTEKLADTKFLKMFQRKFEHNDKQSNWFFCAREDPPLPHAEKKPNAVVMIAEMSHKFEGDTKPKNCLVVISEYRIPISAREWGFPAGLIENGEDPEKAAIREFKEETGMDFVPAYTSAPNLYSSAGLTNESTVLVFGTAMGVPSSDNLESLEDIETYIWDWKKLNDFMIECKQGKHAISDKAWCLFHHYHLKGLREREPSI